MDFDGAFKEIELFCGTRSKLSNYVLSKLMDKNKIVADFYASLVMHTWIKDWSICDWNITFDWNQHFSFNKYKTHGTLFDFPKIKYGEEGNELWLPLKHEGPTICLWLDMNAFTFYNP